MLHTTSVALNDAVTKAFAEQGLKTYARLAQDLNNVIADAVAHDLKDNLDHPVVNPNIAGECRRTIDATWKSTAS
jgi:hypothetical protein